MSVEQEEVTEAPIEQAEQQTEEVVQEQPKQDNYPRGYHPVDLSGLDPEIQTALNDRIGYLFKQVKSAESRDEARLREINEFKEIARLQSERLEELYSGMNQVVDHLEGQTNDQKLDTIRKDMHRAFQDGDFDLYQQKQEQLADLKADIKLQKLSQKPQKTQTQKQAYAGKITASSLAQEGLADGDISPQDANLINVWSSETDERGNPLRPWAQTENPNRPSPDFTKALVIANQFFEDNPRASIAQVLEAVDKQMGTKSRTQNQTVMGGSLTTSAKNTKFKMTPKQEEIAVRTKFGSNKGAKSNAEYIEAFRKQLERSKK